MTVVMPITLKLSGTFNYNELKHIIFLSDVSLIPTIINNYGMCIKGSLMRIPIEALVTDKNMFKIIYIAKIDKVIVK